MIDGRFVQGGCVLRPVQDEVQHAGRETGIAEEGGEEIVRFGTQIRTLRFILLAIQHVIIIPGGT